MAEAKERNPLEWVAHFEKELGLPDGFFTNLLVKEDDWSFIIKLHALVEAAVAHLLAATCGDKLLDVFSRLELSSLETGKLAFAKALDLLDKRERKFIRKLSEIRNSFAHDVTRAGATLAGYVARLDPQQFKAFREAVGPIEDTIEIEGDKIPSANFVRENPKLNIWLGALGLISLIYQRKDLAVKKRELQVLKEEVLEKERRFHALLRALIAKRLATVQIGPKPYVAPT